MASNGRMLDMNDHSDDLLEPTPQAHGFPESPTTQQRNRWLRQTHFLEAFAKLGRIGEAAEAVGITRWAVDQWQDKDLYSFRKRMEKAHQGYVESLEGMVDNRLNNPQGNRGSDILLMFKLKAERPEKYREDVKVVGIDASKMMLDKLREMASKDVEQAKQAELAAPAVEGEYREVAPTLRGVWAPPPAEAPPVPAERPPKTPPGESARDRRAAQVKADQTARRGPTNRVTRR
jgi:hypothetical protein